MSEQSSFASADTSRLDDIEIKLAFAEELLDSLNRTVANQADRIDALSREVIALKKRLDHSARIDSVPADDGSSVGDDRPPHY